MNIEIKKISQDDIFWKKTIEMAESCSWKAAGYNFAQEMRQNKFSDYESPFIAIVNNQVAGFCTIAKDEGSYIPNAPYSPWIGYVFVKEEYRGNRISEKMCKAVIEYASELGFEKIYISTGEDNLYEKYGFKQIDELENCNGGMEKILSIDCERNRIVSMHKSRYMISNSKGVFPGVLKGSFLYEKRGKGGKHTAPEKSELPVIGDYVNIQYNQYGDSLITGICKRKSYFSRNDFSGHGVGYVKTLKEQVLAANFDYVFILSSLNHDYNQNRILRYISLVLKSGAQPVVVLTKMDKANPEIIARAFSEVETLVKDKNIPIYAVSAINGENIDKVQAYFTKGKTIVFLGSSGVGKSTLLNRLAGKEIMNTGGIREDDSKGRHTTTSRELIVLDNGSMIIDTPGIREIGMWDAEEGIKNVFSSVEELTTQCRFSNCSHTNEPGCKILECLQDGTLDEQSWKNYLQLIDENSWAVKKANITKMIRARKVKGNYGDL